MPLSTQQGEIATRLRRFFRVTGRIPSQLDETVVPVSVIQQLDRHPYFDDPQLVHWGAHTAASAGNVQAFGPRAGASDVVAVDRVIYSQGLAGRMAIYYRNVNLAVGLAAGNQDHAANVELHRPSSSGTVTFLAAAFAGLTLITEIRCGQDSPLIFEFPWVLYPGDMLLFGPEAVNISFGLDIQGRVYSAAGFTQQQAG